MLAALTLLVVVAMSLLITRVATTALTLTGLSRETARFQARSALTGAGFTTTESEQVVNHPVRRRIVMTLMLMGSASVVTVVATAALSFADIDSGRDVASRGGTLLVGLALLVWAATSARFDRALQPLITRLLRRYTDLDTRDYARLLHVAGDYSVSELVVEETDWLAGRTLAEARLSDEGVLVLGVQRPEGSYEGAPKGWTHVDAGDLLVLYGHVDRLVELDERRAGDGGERAHAAAMAEQHERYLEARADEERENEPSAG